MSGLEKSFPGSNNKTVNASVACHFIEAQIFVTECCLFAMSVGTGMYKSSDNYMCRITTYQLGLDALRCFERKALPMPRRLGNGEGMLFIAVAAELL